MTENEIDSKDLSKRKRLAFKIIAVFGGLLCGLIAAETCLRIAGYSFPEFYASDEQLGYSLIPNMAGSYRKEGETFIEINSDGLRDIGHPIAKPENTVRIAILGDSYSEAFQVPLKDTFWNVMRDELKKCDAFDGQNIEVINFGVSGYGTAQELITLREKAWKYDPDIILLAVTTNNDITDNSKHFKKTSIPYFVIKDGKPILDESFQNEKSFQVKNSKISHLGGLLYNSLRVVQAIHQAQIAVKYKFQEWKKNPAQPAETPVQNSAPVKTDVGIDNEIYRVPSDEFWTDAWQITEGIISMMNDEVRQHGAKFLVVTLSNGAQVLPERQRRLDFAKSIGADDIFYPDKRIASFCNKNGIRVITLAPELQQYAEKNNVFLHGVGANIGFGHWNVNGHRIAGEILGRKICEGKSVGQSTNLIK